MCPINNGLEKHATKETNSIVGIDKFNHRFMSAIDEKEKLAMAMVCKTYSPNLPKYGVEKILQIPLILIGKRGYFKKKQNKRKDMLHPLLPMFLILKLKEESGSRNTRI